MAVSRLSKQSLQNAFPKGNTIWDGTTATSAFDTLGAVVCSASTSTITFSNIPQTYTHLQVRATFATNASNNLFGQINGDTGNSYTGHTVYGNTIPGTPSAASDGQGVSYAMNMTYADAANRQHTAVFDYFDYTDTNKFKTVKRIAGYDANGTGFIQYGSHAWTKAGSGVTSPAITSLNFYVSSSGTLNQYSHFALYGIK
jgi:hypothetical protein